MFLAIHKTAEATVIGSDVEVKGEAHLPKILLTISSPLNHCFESYELRFECVIIIIYAKYR